MNTEELLQQAEELLKPWAKEVSRPEDNRLDVRIEREDLLAAVDALILKAHRGYLAAITGLDHPEDEQVELVYTFPDMAALVNLRVSVPYADAQVPTLCDLIPSATLYERELMEMFGVTVVGTPDPARLLLSDDWPEGVYPLRKSFTGFDQLETESES
ncbi:MAG TPA: NADH-quinone oxidoreductase subunit C [Chloroflexi bacterium]|jgi:Ni,Fe-hydrogenase III component G|nr:NADH-quinone oxidoreductase subunit C [Chloroflexota bacterium]